MELYKILEKRCCTVGLKAKTKEEVVRKLAKIACKSELLADIQEKTVFEKLHTREQQGTTGFGNGIAIPHARIEGMKDFLLFIVVSPKGVNYEAMDKHSVHIFFVILGPPDKVDAHLKILATISRMLSKTQLRKELLQVGNPETLYETFVRYTRIEGEQQEKTKEKMKLMIVVLYVDDFLYNVLEFFIEEGIEGATVIDSYGMGEYISNVPLFATFIGFMNENKNQSKTLLSLVPETKVKALIEGIEEITGDMDKRQGAMVFTMDVDFYKGTMKMM
ncbi:MAG: PTS sugar transporter subunit IIA [Spirochaetia bacterium]